AVIEEKGYDNSVVSKLETTADDGKTYSVLHYNLDVILPVGYRVKSPEASRFRRWANDVIRDYLTKGVAINERRLESLDDEILERVADSTIKSIVNSFRKKGFSDGMIRSRLNGIIARHDITHAMVTRIIDEVYS